MHSFSQWSNIVTNIVSSLSVIIYPDQKKSIIPVANCHKAALDWRAFHVLDSTQMNTVFSFCINNTLRQMIEKSALNGGPQVIAP